MVLLVAASLQRHESIDARAQPGQPAKLVVDLRAGTYKVYCPVADHEERGITRPLVAQ
ncbi:MAG TPA: hypothetical protein VF111_08100 [Thermoanaerobaculia bacterium]